MEQKTTAPYVDKGFQNNHLYPITRKEEWEHWWKECVKYETKVKGVDELKDDDWVTEVNRKVADRSLKNERYVIWKEYDKVNHSIADVLESHDKQIKKLYQEIIELKRPWWKKLFNLK